MPVISLSGGAKSGCCSGRYGRSESWAVLPVGLTLLTMRTRLGTVMDENRDKDSLPSLHETVNELTPLLPAPLEAAWNIWRRKQLTKARQEIETALKNQHLTLDDVADRDELAGPLLRYFKAADDGIAERNIRLLAQVIAFHAVRPMEASTLDDLLRILATLTRDEIVVIGTLHRLKDEEKGEELKQAIEELVPDTFPTAQHVRAVAARAQRSGLLLSVSAFASGYATSPAVELLEQKPEFQAIVADPFAALEKKHRNLDH